MRTFLLFIFFLCAGLNIQAQLEDPLIEKFYLELYHFNFNAADSALNAISQNRENEMLTEMASITYGWWMLISGAYNEDDTRKLLLRIDRNIDKLEKANKTTTKQDELLQLILLYSFQSRIQKEMNQLFTGLLSYKESFNYFLQLEPCETDNCDIYNLVAGLYYALTGYLYDDYPLLFMFFGNRELADIKKGHELLRKGTNSAISQIKTESIYFFMKIYNEIEEQPAKALPYATKLVEMYPENLIFRFNQLLLLQQLELTEEYSKKYQEFYRILSANQQLGEAQRKHLREISGEKLRLPEGVGKIANLFSSIK